MAIDKKAIRKAQKQRVYEKNKGVINNPENVSYNSSSEAHYLHHSNHDSVTNRSNPSVRSAQGGIADTYHSSYTVFNAYTNKNGSKSRKSTSASKKTLNRGGSVANSVTSVTSATSSLAVNAVKNSNEDNNAGAEIMTDGAAAVINLSGRVGHYSSTVISSSDLSRNVGSQMSTDMNATKITDNVNFNSNIISNKSYFTWAHNGGITSINTSKKSKYNRNRKKLYKRIQEKLRNYNIQNKFSRKKSTAVAKEIVKKSSKSSGSKPIIMIAAVVLAAGVFISVMTTMIGYLFTNSSSFSDIMADYQYAYPADENDITRATVHWQSLIVGLNSRFDNVPNIVTGICMTCQGIVSAEEATTEDMLSVLTAEETTPPKKEETTATTTTSTTTMTTTVNDALEYQIETMPTVTTLSYYDEILKYVGTESM